MSTLDQVAPNVLEPSATPARGRWWDRLDALITGKNELLNPILVKEARQALKSRQFAMTFTLLLACAWGWSMFGVAVAGPDVSYRPTGPMMFSGYYCILAFPLLVIVPFTAFRSLAAESEDGTFELLSITTLKPRQIVTGKLGSAILQMLVYFSAISPCLAFTYMLRGIDFPTILLVLFWTFVASLSFSAVGLLLATATKERHWQMVLSVLLIFGLGLSFLYGCIGTFATVETSFFSVNDSEFWVVNAGMLTAVGSYLLLTICAASAQLTFASENRSTMLRRVMLFQQVLLVGWIGGLMFAHSDDVELVPLVIGLMMLLAHWYAMGIMMTSESAQLSERITRRLPQSWFGRSMLTWFNPGSGTGYIFALANFSTMALASLFVWYASDYYLPVTRNLPRPLINNLPWFIFYCFCYLVVYLGVGRLLCSLLRRIIRLPMMLAVLLQLLLLVAGCLIPLTVHLMRADIRNDYSLIELSNPFWTLLAILDGDLGSPDLMWGGFLLGLIAAGVFGLNLPGIAREVARVRMAKPFRVAEEDAEIAARSAPAPLPTNPWDEPEVPAAT